MPVEHARNLFAASRLTIQFPPAIGAVPGRNRYRLCQTTKARKWFRWPDNDARSYDHVDYRHANGATHAFLRVTQSARERFKNKNKSLAAADSGYRHDGLRLPRITIGTLPTFHTDEPTHMDIAALFQIAMFQLLTARDAPLPVALASVVVALVVWWLTRWRSDAVIQSLKRAMVRRDAELEKLRAHIPMGADTPDAAEGEPMAPRSAEKSVDQRALRLVVNAIDQADMALRSGDGREIDRAQSSMGLALQTVSRHFGLPVPDLATSATDSLAIGKRYLEQVRPALRAGDRDAAHDAAIAFLSP